MTKYYGVYMWTINQMIDFLTTNNVKNFDKFNPLSDFEHYLESHKSVTNVLKYGKRINYSIDYSKMNDLYIEYFNKYSKKSPHYCVKLVDCSSEIDYSFTKAVISYLQTKENWRNGK